MEKINLSGIWQFRLDPDNTGSDEHWERTPFSDKIQIPGILQAQGFGRDVSIHTDWVSALHDPLWYLRDEYHFPDPENKSDDPVQIPFLSQPPKHYTGKAWYRREFQINKSQDGLIGNLFLECTKWRTAVWLDGKKAGEDMSLCTPHTIPLGVLKEGSHTLTVCIDNGFLLPYRPDGHGISDALGATWNGMTGKVEILLSPAVEIKGVRVIPVLMDPEKPSCPSDDDPMIRKHTSDPSENDPSSSQRTCLLEDTPAPSQSRRAESAYCIYHICVENHTGQEQKIHIEALEESESGSDMNQAGCQSGVTGAETGNRCTFKQEIADFTVNPGVQYFDLTGTREYPRELWWDEFNPCLLHKTFYFTSDFGTQEISCDFGIRFLNVSDGKFYLNDRETYFRGTHFGGDFPMTGHPDFSVSWWLDKMNILKEWGLNFIRFHSFCPPEAAFCAADQAGIYLQVECGMWNTFYAGCDMTKTAEVEAFRILDAFGNHPSFVMLSPSNEPGGSWWEELPKWVEACRAYDNRRLYTAQSGWPYPVPPAEISGTDYVYFHRSGFGFGNAGGTIRSHKGWRGGDYRESLKGIRYPVICHELGQWCSYPDYRVIDKFEGAYLQPGNFCTFQRSMEEHGLRDMDKTFSWHSGKLQAAMYKEDLEANFRTPHIYGFELLDLHDYLGQGTALVGVLDAFWQPKGYITPKEWREFCNETVLLARIKSYILTMSEAINIPLEVSHFGREPLGKCRILWTLTEDTKELRRTPQAESPKNSLANVTNGILSIRSESLTQSELSGDIIPGFPKSSGKVLKQGEFTADIKIGKNQAVGDVSFTPASLAVDQPIAPTASTAGNLLSKTPVISAKSTLPAFDFTEPVHLTLRIWIEGTDCRNHWEFWCYPKECPKFDTAIFSAEASGTRNTPDLASIITLSPKSEPGLNLHPAHPGLESPSGSVVITDNWQTMKEALFSGEKVLFIPAQSTLDSSCPPVPFRPAFWNSQMGPSWGRGMGILCEADHPVFAHFPTKSYSTWQWEVLLKGARGFRLEPFTESAPPHVLVRAIDEWNRNANMSLLFEGKVGDGKLMLSTIPFLKHPSGDKPVSPASKWLLYSIVSYMESAQFAPENKLDLAALEKNFFPHNLLKALGGKIYEERNPEKSLSELMDWDAGKTVALKEGHPYHLRIEWDSPKYIRGIYYLPVQNDRLHEGEMKEFRIEAWINDRWESVYCGRRSSGYQPDRILFPSPVCTDQLRLTVTQGFNGENILFYLPCREGWYAERKDLIDTAFSAAILNVIFDEDVWTNLDEVLTAKIYSDSPLSASDTTKTAEIDN